MMKKTREDIMDRKIYNLKEIAEEMKKLSDSLSNEGRELTDRERELCRLATMRDITKHFDETLWFYIRGNMSDLETSLESLTDLMMGL